MKESINTINDTDKMTVFFNKRLGIIDCILVGIHDMSIYGIYEEDEKLIKDFIVIPYDEYIYNNILKFYVNDDLEVKLYPSELEKINNYI